MSDNRMRRFRVRFDGKDVYVDATTAVVDERNILCFYDTDGIRAQFLRWEHYVCEEPASQSSSTAVGSEGQSDE